MTDKIIYLKKLKTKAKPGSLITAQKGNVKNSALDEIDRRKEELKNQSLEQDIRLKKNTLNILFLFLGGETLLVFIYAYLQAIRAKGFALEEWSFKLLISATLLQITYMLQMAVKHLFPTSSGSKGEGEPADAKSPPLALRASLKVRSQILTCCLPL